MLAIGAHPDDIEIGAGGTLLSLAASRPAPASALRGADRHRATGTPRPRQPPTPSCPDAELTVRLHDLPEGRFPGCWSAVKDVLEQVARECQPDLVLAPSAARCASGPPGDRGNRADHLPRPSLSRLRDTEMGWRSEYAVGILSRCQQKIAHRKVELLHKSFPSQRAATGGTTKYFSAWPGCRGMECRAPYAEAFRCAKSVLTIGLPAFATGQPGLAAMYQCSTIAAPMTCRDVRSQRTTVRPAMVRPAARIRGLAMGRVVAG